MCSSAGSAAALLTRQERAGEGRWAWPRLSKHASGMRAALEGWDLLLVRLLLRLGRVQLRRSQESNDAGKKKEKGDRWS